MNFLIGLFLVGGGAASLVYHQQVFNMTGRIDFVEKRLPGGSSSFLKLMGVLAVFLGLLFATGLGSWLTAPINDGIRDVFSPINANY